MPQEQSLLPFIQQAYGRGVQLPSIKPFQDTFEKQAEQKRKDYQSVAELGIDLDANNLKNFEVEMSKMLEQAKEGNLVVGGADWLAQKEKLAATAAQYKQVQDLRKDYTTMLLEKPDQAFIGGKTGIEGVTELQEQLRQIQAQEGLSNAQRINEMAKVMEGVRTLPMGINEAKNAARDDGLAISKQLKELGVTPQQVGTVGGQYIIRGVRGDAGAKALEAEVIEQMNSLKDQYGQYYAIDYTRRNPDAEEFEIEEHVDEQLKALLFTDPTGYKLSSMPRNNKGSGYGRGAASGFLRV
jgi:predicted methyltransferase MtxX (methanogen marker protein 4)